MTVAAASGITALWFITRATGVTALILLTLTVALGVANVQRVRRAALPRFVLDSVHRNASLLAVCFLGLHIVTSVLDGYVPIHWLDAVVPFGGSYRPFWLGLGAVAFDLLVAVMLTSLLRRHFGYRAWRATHWLVYGSWPIAVVHGLGMGSDAGSSWMIVVTLVCLFVVAVAVTVRLRRRGQPSLDGPAPRPRPFVHSPARGRSSGERPRRALISASRR